MNKTQQLARKFLKQLGLEKSQQNLLMAETLVRKYNKHALWVLREFKRGNLLWPEDQDRVDEILQAYNWVTASPVRVKQYGANTNILRCDYTQLGQLADQVNGVIYRPESLVEVPQGAEKVYDDGVWCVLKITDPKCAVQFASGTKWCTSRENIAADYIDRVGALYVWYKNNRKIYQGDISSGLHHLNDSRVLMNLEELIIFSKVIGPTKIHDRQHRYQLQKQLRQQTDRLMKRYGQLPILTAGLTVQLYDPPKCVFKYKQLATQYVRQGLFKNIDPNIEDAIIDVFDNPIELTMLYPSLENHPKVRQLMLQKGQQLAQQTMMGLFESAAKISDFWN